MLHRALQSKLSFKTNRESKNSYQRNPQIQKNERTKNHPSKHISLPNLHDGQNLQHRFLQIRNQGYYRIF